MVAENLRSENGFTTLATQGSFVPRCSRLAEGIKVEGTKEANEIGGGSAV